MNTFDPTLHPRGQAANSGQFRERTDAAPRGALGATVLPPQVAAATARVAEPAQMDEALAVLVDPERYGAVSADPQRIAARMAGEVPAVPSQVLNRSRPTFTGTGERDFHTALDRIDAVWDPHASVQDRSEAVIADMRQSGALGHGAGAAREAYARALVLNETGGIVDEDYVNHLLDHIEAGGSDYRAQARAFGFAPEDYAALLGTAAAHAGYNREHSTDPLTVEAATARQQTLAELAAHAAENLDRGWSSREDDAARLQAELLKAEEASVSATTDVERTRAAATAHAYRFALGMIEADRPAQHWPALPRM